MSMAEHSIILRSNVNMCLRVDNRERVDANEAPRNRLVKHMIENVLLQRPDPAEETDAGQLWTYCWLCSMNAVAWSKSFVRSILPPQRGSMPRSDSFRIQNPPSRSRSGRPK
jgi:hypothetical protein